LPWAGSGAATARDATAANAVVKVERMAFDRIRGFLPQPPQYHQAKRPDKNDPVRGMRFRVLVGN
jgi:hypothetical protein